MEPTSNAGTLLLQAAARYPQRPALWLQGREYSYREIAARVSRLARELHALEGAVCAILGERSLTAYCAPFACLLAGKTFVPLGASFPAARMATMLERSGARILIAASDTDERVAELLASAAVAPAVVRPEHDPEVPAADSPLLPAPLATAAPAYLLFTSGSTGQPKGVAVGHGALQAYVAALQACCPELDEQQRCSQFFEPTFDLSLHDLFVTWAVGACLYCVPAEELMLPLDFANRHRLTSWFSVPSMAAALQRYRLLRPDALPHLRLALFCGEALPGPLAAAWRLAAPAARTVNLYGPTEATIACTAHDLGGGDDAVVPIGHPLPGVEVAVLDAGGQPAAPGVVGELLIGGRQLADGYWRDPALSTERFPQLSVPGCDSRRWYRSGDLAMRDAAGTLHFRGRADRQVKVRGYRVELQEIEAQLRLACGSNEVAVLPLPAAAGQPVPGVAAFIAGCTLDAGAVTAACRSRLPAYMVPAQVRLLDALPLNANGKTDHHQLAAMLDAPARPRRAARATAATGVQ